MVPLADLPLTTWEQQWAPYDEPTYRAVLNWIPAQARVLEIGAGDLRLARRLAQRARQVVAVENQWKLLVGQRPFPANLLVVCADARELPFPRVDVAVLLMRHCTHLALFWEKLTAVGCHTLITNARWGLDVERIDLQAARRPYTELTIGWYACQCGETGFRPGPAEYLTEPVISEINEVAQCPGCLT